MRTTNASSMPPVRTTAKREGPFSLVPPLPPRDLERSRRGSVRGFVRAALFVGVGLLVGLLLSAPRWPVLEADTLRELYDRAAKLEPRSMMLFLDGSPPVHTAVLELGERQYVGRGATPEEALLAALAEVGPDVVKTR
jgi:hypothetical protein